MIPPLLDLVVVAYEAQVETGEFLGSLAHLDVPFTLTIIDNASPNGAVRDTIQRALPAAQGHCRSAQYVFNDRNLGYARAVNQGMCEGAAPYAAILNSDVEFLPSEPISRIVEYFRNHPEVGVVGPRTVDEKNRITHGGIWPGVDGRNTHRGWLQFDRPEFWSIQSAPTVSGATYFVRRQMWQQLTECSVYQRIAPGAEGAFLPTKHYFEETFCSYHARHHGWTCVYFGSVRMVHKWHRSSPVGSQDFTEPRAQFLSGLSLHGIDPAGEA